MTSLRLTAHDHAHHWRSVGMAAGAGLLVALAATMQATPLAATPALTDIRSGLGVVRDSTAGIDATGGWLAPIESVTVMDRLARQLERDPLR